MLEWRFTCDGCGGKATSTSGPDLPRGWVALELLPDLPSIPPKRTYHACSVICVPSITAKMKGEKLV